MRPPWLPYIQTVTDRAPCRHVAWRRRRHVRLLRTVHVLVPRLHVLDDREAILGRQQRPDEAARGWIPFLPRLVARVELVAGIVVPVLRGIEDPEIAGGHREAQLHRVVLAAADRE